MASFMLGRKAGMTQLFTENGQAVPVTVIECGPVTVVRTKNGDVDGYQGVQVAFGDVKESRLNRPALGQFQKSDLTPKRYLREYRVDDSAEFEVGQEITVADSFQLGDFVDVSGTSKGKGFAGNVKRHGQAGGHEAHGSKYHRRVGSMGSSATPARVMKGKKMPGHMGAKRVTVQALEVMLVDGERNILAVKGSVPGPKGSVLEIKTTVKTVK